MKSKSWYPILLEFDIVKGNWANYIITYIRRNANNNNIYFKWSLSLNNLEFFSLRNHAKVNFMCRWINYNNVMSEIIRKIKFLELIIIILHF